MEKVRLLTKDGGFVTSGMIPAFNDPPDVIVWGSRIFQYDSTDDEREHVYIEAFSSYLVIVE